MDATHAASGCITRAKGRRLGGGDEFGDARGAGGEIAGEPTEVVQKVMDVLVEAKAGGTFGFLESLLEGAEEPAGTGDSEHHRA